MSIYFPGVIAIAKFCISTDIPCHTVQVIESTYAHLYRDREESLFLIALDSKRQAIEDYHTKKESLKPPSLKESLLVSAKCT